MLRRLRPLHYARRAKARAPPDSAFLPTGRGDEMTFRRQRITRRWRARATMRRAISLAWPFHEHHYADATRASLRLPTHFAAARFCRFSSTRRMRALSSPRAHARAMTRFGAPHDCRDAASFHFSNGLLCRHTFTPRAPTPCHATARIATLLGAQRRGRAPMRHRMPRDASWRAVTPAYCAMSAVDFNMTRLGRDAAR